MTVTVASFRADFPEFADATAYPDTGILFWLTLGYNLLDPIRWGDLLDPGVELFIAHNIVLEKYNQMAIAAGRPPGLVGGTGVAASKSVGGVSISYNTTFGFIEGAGSYNLTTYGIRFYTFARIIGIGGMQL